MLRRLRYAPAFAFALLALAFVGLWMRSYWGLDEVIGRVSPTHYLLASSQRGVVLVGVIEQNVDHVSGYRSYPVMGIQLHTCPFGFKVLRQGGWGPSGLLFSHWLLALSSLGLSALLAFKPITRFTVRGLLITTTLIAAVLGAVVYAI